MIKYAVMTFMYSKWVNSDQGSHEKLIRILGDAGADGIEAFANHFFGNEGLTRLYESRMPEHGLTMPVMDLISNLAAKEKERRREAYDAMRRGIDVCDKLGTEIIHLAGCKLGENQHPEDGRKWIVEGMMDFIDDIEKRGMTLAFENFNPSPDLICSAEDCLEILKQTDGRVKFVFDTGNFEAAREHAEDHIDTFIDQTVHFHFKDFRPADDPTICVGAPFGQGRIKNREIAQVIVKYGYSGWVALESYLQDDNGPRETVPAELRELKDMFAEASA